MLSVQSKTARAVTARPWVPSIIAISILRLVRSISDPATKGRVTAGIKQQSAYPASAVADPSFWVIHQARAMPYNPSPSIDTLCPDQTSQKSRYLRNDREVGSAGGGSGVRGGGALYSLSTASAHSDMAGA